MHGDDALFVVRLCAPSPVLLEEVILVRGKEYELVICDEEGAVGVGFMLTLYVRSEVGAGDCGVLGREEDVDWIVNGVPACNNLGVIVVEVRVYLLNVALN